MNARQTFTPATVQTLFSKKDQTEMAAQEFLELLDWEVNEDVRKTESLYTASLKQEISRKEDELFGPLPSISLWEEMENELNDDLESSFLLMEEELKKIEAAMKRLVEDEFLSCQAEVQFFHPEFRVEKVEMAPARVRSWRRGFMPKQWRLA